MAYEDLVEVIKSCDHRMTRFEVVAYLIRWQAVVDKYDLGRINRAYQEGLLEN